MKASYLAGMQVPGHILDVQTSTDPEAVFTMDCVCGQFHDSARLDRADVDRLIEAAVAHLRAAERG